MNLDEIEEILSEIERLNRESGGQFRQVEDREAYDIVCRIERKMQQQKGASRGAQKTIASESA